VYPAVVCVCLSHPNNFSFNGWMKITVFWDAVLCCLTDENEHSGEAWLPPSSRRKSRPCGEKKNARCSEPAFNIPQFNVFLHLMFDFKVITQ
jgi:hypothetical protein